MTEALIGVGVVLLLNIIAFSIAYGRLIQKVVNLCDVVNNHLRTDIYGIYTRIDDIDSRLSHIEGYLEAKDSDDRPQDNPNDETQAR